MSDSDTEASEAAALIVEELLTEARQATATTEASGAGGLTGDGELGREVSALKDELRRPWTIGPGCATRLARIVKGTSCSGLGSPNVRRSCSPSAGTPKRASVSSRTLCDLTVCACGR